MRMRKGVVVLGVLAGMLAGCSAEPPGQHAASGARVAPTIGQQQSSTTQVDTAESTIASAADTGALVVYDRGQRDIRRDGMIYHPVELSESHALHAIADGTLELTTPDGEAISVPYTRNVDHEDGNWTWVGHADPKTGGSQALLTFGEKAVFGSITRKDGRELQVTTMGGRTYLVEQDPKVAAHAPNPEAGGADALAVPVIAQIDAAKKEVTRRVAAGGKVSTKTAGSLRAEESHTPVTIDLLIGYSATFASRLGGTSQAMTRLNNMVAVANDAYTQSQVDATLRLVHAMQVDYPDTTANRTALFELTGVTCTNGAGPTLPTGELACTSAPRPAALQTLVNARQQYGADLVTLVRPLRMPEQTSCGTAWMIGGGQRAFDSTSDDFAFSVVSDSSNTGFPSNGSTCRNETLVHELGHNMGLQHDRVTAAGANGTLEADEFGHNAYSFGFRTDAANGNFYTIMAVRQTGQVGYRVFSSPLLTVCGGRPCGVTDQADNARTLHQTLPLVAAFRAPPIAYVDVPTSYWAYDAIRRIAAAGITTGCSASPPAFCPTAVVKRDQMAIFLLRGIHGSGYQPPSVSASSFADVPDNFWALTWIEQLVNEGITSGCGTNPAVYCPAGSVTRAQMAVFLLRASHGSAYVPPPATGMFDDVPQNYWAAAWIEALANEGITGGCAADRYCPDAAVTRDQMAVFLVRTFDL